MVEFNAQDSPAFDEVMGVLKRYRDFEYVQIDDDSILSVPGLEIYPSRRKIYRGRKEICLTTKEYDFFYLLVVNRGQCREMPYQEPAGKIVQGNAGCHFCNPVRQGSWILF